MSNKNLYGNTYTDELKNNNTKKLNIGKIEEINNIEEAQITPFYLYLYKEDIKIDLYFQIPSLVINFGTTAITDYNLLIFVLNMILLMNHN